MYYIVSSLNLNMYSIVSSLTHPPIGRVYGRVYPSYIYDDAILPLLKLSTCSYFKYRGSPVKIGNGFVFIYFKCVWSLSYWKPVFLKVLAHLISLAFSLVKALKLKTLCFVASLFFFLIDLGPPFSPVTICTKRVYLLISSPPQSIYLYYLNFWNKCYYLRSRK